MGGSQGETRQQQICGRHSRKSTEHSKGFMLILFYLEFCISKMNQDTVEIFVISKDLEF